MVRELAIIFLPLPLLLGYLPIFLYPLLRLYGWRKCLIWTGYVFCLCESAWVWLMAAALTSQ